jgi:hypothetical protein
MKIMYRFPKIIFLIVIAQAITINSYGQIFSLNELISLNSKNIDQFDTYVTKKGYEFAKTETKDSMKNWIYNFNRNYDKGAQYWIELTEFLMPQSIHSYMISWYTLEKKDYISIKEQIISAGFKLLSSETLDSGVISYSYSKGKITINLYNAASKLERDSPLQNTYVIDVGIKK